MQKKKRKENSGDYEFAVLQDEEEGSSALGGIGGVGSSRGTGVGGGGRSGGAGGVGGRRKKARELYDAFGASDDEEDVFSLDEDDDEKYRSSRDYDLEEEEAVHGVDEGKRETGTDRERLLGSSRD